MACMDYIKDIVDERRHELASMPRETKSCGHQCYPSSVAKCCACSDLRPVREEGTYPSYADGTGATNDGKRSDHYCPVCCPNNFLRWQRRRDEEAARVAARHERLDAERALATSALAEDRDRARAGEQRGPFEYQNGDLYDGQWLDGERHGRGTMTYAEDGSTYDGDWRHGKEHGRGRKEFLDGISYVGDFENGMMHGQGRFTMADGVVLDGAFLEDEWQGA